MDGMKLIVFNSLDDYLEFMTKDISKHQLDLIEDYLTEHGLELARPVNQMCRLKFLNQSQKIKFSLSKRVKSIKLKLSESSEESLNETLTPLKRNFNFSFILYSILISCIVSIGLIVLAYFNVKLNRYFFQNIY